MDEIPKKIAPVAKRKIYIAWILVLGLAVVLIGLSLFFQSRFQSRFSTSAAVQINLSLGGLEGSGVTLSEKIRCTGSEPDSKHGSVNGLMEEYRQEMTGKKTYPTFPQWLRTQADMAGGATGDALKKWADCLDDKCSKEELALQKKLGITNPSPQTANDDYYITMNARGGHPADAEYDAWQKCLKSDDSTTTLPSKVTCSDTVSITNEIKSKAKYPNASDIQNLDTINNTYSKGERTATDASKAVLEQYQVHLSYKNEVGNNYNFEDAFNRLSEAYKKCPAVIKNPCAKAGMLTSDLIDSLVVGSNKQRVQAIQDTVVSNKDYKSASQTTLSLLSNNKSGLTGEIGNPTEVDRALNDISSAYLNCQNDKSATGSANGDKGKSTGSEGDHRATSGNTSGLGGRITRVLGDIGGEVLRKVLPDSFQSLFRRDVARQYDFMYAREYKLKKALLRLSSLRTVVESFTNIIEDVKGSDWNAVVGDVFDGLMGYTNYKYAGDIIGEPSLSRDTVLSLIDYAQETGDSQLLSELTNGGYGLFGNDGSFSMPNQSNRNTSFWQQAFGSDGSINNEYLNTITQQQKADLLRLQAGILGSGLAEGYLLDSNGDGVPDNIQGSKVCSNLSRCYYFARVNDEYIYMPAEAVLQSVSGGTPGSYWIARNFAGTKYYPFVKGLAKGADNALGTLSGMLVPNNSGGLSLLEFITQPRSTSADLGYSSGDSQGNTCPDDTTCPLPQ